MRVIAPFKQRGRARRKTCRRGRRRTQGRPGTGGTEKAATVRICPAPQKGMTGRQGKLPPPQKIKRGPAGKASVYYSFSRGTRQLLSRQDVRQERQQKSAPLSKRKRGRPGCGTICFSALPLREGNPSAPGVQGHCAYDADKPCRLSARQLWAWRSPLRILTRWILPETVLGSSSTNSTMRGYL